MIKFFRFRSLVVLVVLMATLLGTTVSNGQGTKDDPGPGKGGPIVVPNFGSDIQSLNPLIIKDGPSGGVAGLIFPAFIAANPDTGLPEGGTPGAIVKKWDVSADGLTYTFTLRDDYKWNDGTPVTSADVKYAFDAVMSGKIDSNITSFLTSIDSLTAPSPTSVVVKFKAADCAAVLTAVNIPVVPSKKYQEVYAKLEDMKPGHDYNLKPTVSGGPFKFSNFRPGEQVTLLADQTYGDAVLKHVVPEGYVLKQVADQTVGVEQFINGQITYIPSLPEQRVAEIKAAAAAGKYHYGELPASTRHVLAFNVADPNDPKDGMDKDGNPVDQGHHPILGDKRVRQAFALSIDHAALNKGAFFGQGIPIGSPVLMNTWAYNENVKPWPYDPVKAAQLLDEAGFVDDDKNPDTPRVANDKALYAKPGTKLEFTLMTYSGNASVDDSNVLMQNMVKKTGFNMKIDTLDFNTMIQKMQSQKFDAVTFFLGMSRNNPGNTMLSHHGLRGDKLNSGLNVGSWYNKEFDDLLTKSQSLPGCDMKERKALLDKAQEIIREELPWYFVNYAMVPFASQGALKNWEVKKFSATWNLDAWFMPTAK